MFSRLRALLGGQQAPAPAQGAGFACRWLTPDYAVCPQITPADPPRIVAAGFRTVICLRPDAEDPGQPDAATMADACAAAGLAFAHVPVRPGTPGDAGAMRAALAANPGPVLGYCRSGARAVQLWQAAQSTDAPA